MELIIGLLILYFGFKLLNFTDKTLFKLKKHKNKSQKEYLSENNHSENRQTQESKTYEFKTLLGCQTKREPDINIETKAVGVTFENLDGSSRQYAIQRLIPGQHIQLAWYPENPYGENSIYIFGTGDHSNLDMETCVGQINKDLAKCIMDFVKSDISDGVTATFIKSLGGRKNAPTFGCLINVDIFIDHAKVAELGNTDPLCPHCNATLLKMTLRKTVCKTCNKEMFSKKSFNGQYLLMTEENHNKLMDYRDLTNGLYYHSMK